MSKHLVLSAFLMPGGYDQRAWRHAGSPAEDLGKLSPLEVIAQKYEAAKLDSIFIADVISASYILDGDVFMGNPYEPASAMGALASSTDRIGLIGTFSTTWNHPFTLARQLQALDVLSDGRAGWNIVTSSRAEENYGSVLPPKEERYRRAAEVVEAMRQLWAAWSDKAVIADRESGNWVDPALIRPIDFEGEFVKVQGFLNQRRSPQGHPVLAQAGQSPDGVRFGSAVADLIYTAQPSREHAIDFRMKYREALSSVGRNPDHVKITPGLVPYVAETETEAQELFRAMDRFTDFEAAKAKFTAEYRVDLSGLDLDEPIPLERFDTLDMTSSRGGTYREMTEGNGFTLRQILVNASSSSGHLVAVGTASQVADTMIDWFESDACDGFSLNAPLVPETVDSICELLVPELRSRGYFREEYTGTTLRDHLGLPIPPAWDEQ